MLFNSFHFLLFFILVTITYFSIPNRWRWLFLLVASCYFYMAFVPIYILILGITIIIDYFAGIYIEKANGKKKKLFLTISLIANIGVLAIFKYYNFLNENLSFLLKGFAIDNPLPFLSILLPVGLSFHTFQAMSYTIEVYRGNQPAERHFGIYSLYVMFYPQLVAGPIERPQNLLFQFKKHHPFDYERITSGLKLMAWGLFKKVVIADRLSILVDKVYASPTTQDSTNLTIATLFFTFQIFCDFSGYSDIAIGTARVMGFDLMKNFDRPYNSKSIDEFWKKWHISLSTWFKDYLYIPLGGNRVTIPRWYFNLFIVFLISGLWHGANWTFIIWGALHGTYLVLGHITLKHRQSLNKILKIENNNFLKTFTTFSLVAFAWIFFRADTTLSALYICKKIIIGIPETFINIITLNLDIDRMNLGMKFPEFVLSIILIITLEAIHFASRRKNISTLLSNQPPIIRWFTYVCITAIILFLGVFEDRQFIYFQF